VPPVGKGRRPQGPRKPQQPQDRINDGIRAKQVRLIAADGEQRGIVATREALEYADSVELDLVQVSDGDGETPVCRVMDYSKHRYEKQKQEREARRKSAKNDVKEVRLRPKIAEHDYETKRNHVRKFLEQGHEVQVQVQFRGREMAHPQIGRKLLDRMTEEVADLGKVKTPPNQDGRFMKMVIAPLAKKQ
jgi:translation initiation factor IF-3